MIRDSKVLAIIPARSGSKGLPDKNIRNLGGLPLLAWPIIAASRSTIVDSVVVSTDSGSYAAIASEYGADVPVLRSSEISNDHSPTSEAVIEMLDFLETQGQTFNYFVLLEPTSPLTESTDIDNAIKLLDSRRDVADALVSVALLNSSHPSFIFSKSEHDTLEPFVSVEKFEPMRRQDAEPLFALDGSLYISEVRKFRDEETFCHDRTMSYNMPQHKNIEIDSIVDFICVEALMAQMDSLTENLSHQGAERKK